jgi:hypothetical protein
VKPEDAVVRSLLAHKWLHGICDGLKCERGGSPGLLLSRDNMISRLILGVRRLVYDEKQMVLYPGYGLNWEPS